MASCGMDTHQKTRSPPQTSPQTSATFSQKGAHGYNQAGVETSCTIPPEQAPCTSGFTVGEEFVTKCRAAGGQEFACSCHNYLCSKKIIFP